MGVIMKIRMTVNDLYSLHDGIILAAKFAGKAEILDDQGNIIGCANINLEGKIGFHQNPSAHIYELDVIAGV